MGWTCSPGVPMGAHNSGKPPPSHLSDIQEVAWPSDHVEEPKHEQDYQDCLHLAFPPVGPTTAHVTSSSPAVAMGLSPGRCAIMGPRGADPRPSTMFMRPFGPICANPARRGNGEVRALFPMLERFEPRGSNWRQSQHRCQNCSQRAYPNSALIPTASWPSIRRQSCYPNIPENGPTSGCRYNHVLSRPYQVNYARQYFPPGASKRAGQQFAPAGNWRCGNRSLLKPARRGQGRRGAMR